MGMHEPRLNVVHYIGNRVPFQTQAFLPDPDVRVTVTRVVL